MKKHWQYLLYVIRHKFYVYQEARKLGVSLWQALIHDYHKFYRDEWIPYTNFFYGEWPTNDDAMMVYPLYEGPTKESVQADFDVAWLKHQHRAPHHWQHWVLPEDNGGTKVLEIPDKYRREMLADWRGMGRAFGEHPPAVGWYEKNKDKMQLHPDTRAWVEAELGVDV